MPGVGIDDTQKYIEVNDNDIPRIHVALESITISHGYIRDLPTDFVLLGQSGRPEEVGQNLPMVAFPEVVKLCLPMIEAVLLEQVEEPSL